MVVQTKYKTIKKLASKIHIVSLMNWKELSDTDQVDRIIKSSVEKPQLIFKHSTTCGISAMMKSKLEETWDIDTSVLDVHYLDLLTYRSVSNYIAETTGVYHQSPQVVLLKNGAVVMDASHHAIKVEAIKKELG